MYGGRAIDLFDRRVLNTYMDEYMGDFIFDKFQPFYFHRTADVAYYIPTANEAEAPATGLPPKELALGKITVELIIPCNYNYHFSLINNIFRIIET